MADNFLPMGGTPDFYGSLLNSAQQQLVRMPDGSYQMAPQYQPPTSLGQIYGGMYAQPGSSGSAALRADPVGDMAASGGWNQFDDQFNSPAALSPNSGRMRTASANPSIPGPRGSINLNKDQSRLDPGTALAFAGSPNVPPGLAAINAMAPPSIPLPRIRPQLPSDMQWQPTVPGAYDGTDPWAKLRVGPPPNRPGMITAQPRGTPVTVRGGAPTVPQPHPLFGLLASLLGGAPQVPSAPSAPVGYQPLPSDPLQAAVIAAQRNGQTYDRSRDPSFNPNGGANGGSYSH